MHCATEENTDWNCTVDIAGFGRLVANGTDLSSYKCVSQGLKAVNDRAWVEQREAQVSIKMSGSGLKATNELRGGNRCHASLSAPDVFPL